MRFHVVSLPHTHTTGQFPSCAFTQKVVRFCQMMTALGHEVILYGGEKNEAPCAEHVVCVNEQMRLAMVGGRHYTEADWAHPLWMKYNARAVAELRTRLQQQDFICLIGGYAQKAIADAFPDHISVEFGIGYSGTFAKYRVFESYAWMHMVYGAEAGRADQKDGHWFDAVIPNQVDDTLFHDPATLPSPKGSADAYLGAWGPPGEVSASDEAELRSKAERLAAEDRLTSTPYFLYVGRLVDRKGYRIAQEVCEKLGKRLILAGPGAAQGYGEFVGEVGPQLRTLLMSRAEALFAPTIYVEPFGTVTIEAMACGTPVITSDWGAFTETVAQGVDGFRCRSFAEFRAAVEAAPSLDRRAIRERALGRFSMAVVAAQYEAYFARLSTLWGAGWYA